MSAPTESILSIKNLTVSFDGFKAVDDLDLESPLLLDPCADDPEAHICFGAKGVPLARANSSAACARKRSRQRFWPSRATPLWCTRCERIQPP